MKTLSHIKWVVVILFGCLAITLISTNCTPEPGREVSRPGDGDDADNGERTRGTLKCELPSGNGSCGKDDDCVEWCKEDLDLTGDDRNKCLDLDEDTVAKLVSDDKDVESLFGDVLDNPDYKELADLDTDDVDLICAAVKELNYKILKNRIDEYSAADAKDVLEWLAGKKEAIEIFENAEDDEGLKMVKKLLSVAGGHSSSVTDDDVLEGLIVDDVKTDGENNENNNVLRLALDENNERFIDYIHSDIIEANKELCGGRTNANRPTIEASCYSSSAAENAANGYAEEACVLGVYCKMAPGTPRGTRDEIARDDADNEFRQDIADYLDDNSIRKFIEADVASGGLSGAGAESLTEDDAENWTKAVCTRLAACWADSSSLTLGL